ncbi:hypothetical protein JIG36_01470 [Actinoplanes sp. LDG1-06]|uniref:Uncharacterized protein n=1 Tax=Paractinoplanes ovalisporus TaxID=2810368 RepID=A0ABS2A4L8_9ACTN|nr:hypothetical protein [Actinoplanes ovalisporus]MBM2614224.1 hypothetical protein [Actinoplanes ovalisporus]
MRRFQPRHWVAAAVAVGAFVVLTALLFQPPRTGPDAPAEPVHQHHAAALDPVTAVVLGANVVVLLGIVVLEVRRSRHSAAASR